jgi:histidyl-tRNA synthetase
MYRHERPQKGRYRQFIQLGVETYGMQSPETDAELLLLMHRLWQRLGIRDKVTLQLNSLGTSQERLVYRDNLIAYFEQYPEQLDEDSQRRLHTNPLRILDSKNPAMHALITNAPVLMDYLGEASLNHFKTITDILDDLGISYAINTRLVRGLDYYCNTVFEWVTTELGSQGTVCAGGRYDGLIAQLGGKENHAVGFAMGMERLLALMETVAIELPKPIEVYLIRVGDNAQQVGLRYAEKIRDAIPQLKLQINTEGGSFKNQFKKADKSGADYALIIGEDEVINNAISIKSLRDNQGQQTLSLAQAIIFLLDYFVYSKTAS